MRFHRRLAFAIVLVPLALLAACAPAARPVVAPLRHSADVDKCRPDGQLVVHNGESIAIELVATGRSTAWSFGGEPARRLGTVAAGRTDTIPDIPRELTRVIAMTNSAHAAYPSNEINGYPKNTPTKVHFSCTTTRQGS